MDIEPVTNCFQALTLYKGWNTQMRYCPHFKVIIFFSVFQRVIQALRHLFIVRKLIALQLEILSFYLGAFISEVETFVCNAFGI